MTVSSLKFLTTTLVLSDCSLHANFRGEDTGGPNQSDLKREGLDAIYGFLNLHPEYIDDLKYLESDEITLTLFNRERKA